MVKNPGFSLFILFRDIPLKSSVFLGGCMVRVVINLQKKSCGREQSGYSEFSEGLEVASGKIMVIRSPLNSLGCQRLMATKKRRGDLRKWGV